jgi:hypothetical protein
MDNWYDRICDPIIDELNKKRCFVLLQAHKYFRRRHTCSMFIQPHLFFYGVIISRWKLYKHRKVSYDLNMPGYSDAVDYLNSKKIPYNLISLSGLKKNVVQIKTIAGFYKKNLNTLTPKMAFQVAYYGSSGYAFNLACRELNIRSIDIQHGVQGEFHGAYGKWSKLPENGYELLPNIFLCWDKNDADAINKWASKVKGGHKAIVGGNRFLDRWFIDTDSAVVHYDNIIRNKKNNLGNMPSILYTLNGLESFEVLNAIIELVKKSSEEYFWWLRCHPCFLEQKKLISNMLKSNNVKNADLDISNSVPLYALLRNMNLHITECSSVIIEAEAFSVPSIVTTEYGAQ